MRWAHNIDLGEFADNLKGMFVLSVWACLFANDIRDKRVGHVVDNLITTDSGVHGGLVVLEPSFTGETMATALGIPPSKSIIRRHLVAEFDALVIPARWVNSPIFYAKRGKYNICSRHQFGKYLYEFHRINQLVSQYVSHQLHMYLCKCYIFLLYYMIWIMYLQFITLNI